MSFEPVTSYHFRCDGNTTRGQCDVLYGYYPDGDEDNKWHTPNVPAPSFEGWESDLRYGGWLVAPDSRLLCPVHVKAAGTLVAAALDGLPFDEVPSGSTQR